MRKTSTAILAPILASVLASTASASVGQVTLHGPHARASVVSMEVQEAPPEVKKSDLKKLQAAQRVLAQQGYASESQALLDIIARLKDSTNSQAGKKAGDKATSQEGRKAEKRAKAQLKKASKRIEARAKKLLKRDINERSARVEMLELLADGFAIAEYETSEEALRFFVSAARTEPGQVNPLPMPESLNGGESTVMNKLIHFVQSGDQAMKRVGCKNGAAVAVALGRFYVERENSRSAPPVGGESEPDAGAAAISVKDLVTIERRAPILGWAAKAFAGEDADPEARKRTAWIADIARNQVNPGAVPAPAPVAFSGMEQVMEDLQRAAEIYANKGDQESAEGCRALAEYYRLREAGEIADESSDQPRAIARPVEPSTGARSLRGLGYVGGDDDDGEADARARIAEQRRIVAELTEELERLRAELAAMDDR